jgi:hypothetical protein
MLSGSWRQFAVLVSHVIIRAGDILGRCIMGNHPREPLTHDSGTSLITTQSAPMAA